MATEREYQGMYDRIAALRDTVTGRMSSDLLGNPQLADALMKQIDDLLQSTVDADANAPAPPDKGLSALAGLGPQAAADLGDTRIPQGVEAYDETVTSELIIAVGDLYYLYQHEKIGVFRVVQKLQELFRAGAVRLSSGAGAFALYQYDRREVLRYTQRPHCRVQADFRVRRRSGTRGRAAQHRFPHHVHALRESGDAVLAR